MRRRFAARLALAAFAVGIAGGDRLTIFAFTLAHAAAAVLAIAKMRHVELRQRNADEIVALAADHLAVGDVFPQVLAYFPANDLFEPRRVAVDFHYHIRGGRSLACPLLVCKCCSKAGKMPTLNHFFFTSPRANMLAT